MGSARVLPSLVEAGYGIQASTSLIAIGPKILGAPCVRAGVALQLCCCGTGSQPGTLKSRPPRPGDHRHQPNWAAPWQVSSCTREGMEVVDFCLCVRVCGYHDHVAARARRRRCTRLRRLSTTTARRTSRADDAVATLALRIVFSRPGLERAPVPLFRVLRCGEAHLVRTWVVGIGRSGYSGLSLPASSPSLEGWGKAGKGADVC